MLSNDYALLANAVATSLRLMGEGAVMRRSKGEKMKKMPCANSPEALLWLREEAERSVRKQRYIGLNEMNPEQLWKPRCTRPCAAC